MTARGAIEVEHASRRFRVYPKEGRTLKDVVLARGRVRAQEVWALRDVSFSAEPGSALGLVGRNGSGKTTLLRLLSGIVRPTSGRVAVGGRVGTLLELGAGFHPDFTGRENVFLNGSILGLKRAKVREHLDEIVAFAGLERFIDLPVRTYSSGMYMRLGFAIAAHLEADVLLLDEVFAVGDEAFQRKCFGKIFEFKRRGGTIVFVSHDASAVERLCERAILLRDGGVAFDGETHDAVTEYHRQLADEQDPEERSAGLSEWGSGEAHVVSARLLGPEGEERLQFSAGDAMTIRIEIAAREAIPPPRLSYELRDDTGILLAGGTEDTAALGWEAGDRALVARFDVDRLPLADGRFRLRLGLSDRTGEHLYHQVDDALQFVVYPGGGDARGLVRIDGRWSKEDAPTAAKSATQ